MGDKKAKADMTPTIDESMWNNSAAYRALPSKQHLEGLQSSLRSSHKKGGFFKSNSERFEEVDGALQAIVTQLNSPLDNNTDKAQTDLLNLGISYGRLVTACQAYLARSPRSRAGKARQAIVAQILAQAQSDRDKVYLYADQHTTLPATERARTMADVMDKARRRVIQLKKTDAEHQHVGGNASRLTVLEQGDVEGSDVSGFFKEEENFTYYDNKKDAALMIMENIRRRSPISQHDFEKLLQIIRDSKSTDAIRYYKKVLADADLSGMGPQVPEFIERFNEKAELYHTQDDNIMGKEYLNGEAHLKNGESMSLSNRNVATTRIADLLGIGHIVARSESVEIWEPGQARGRRGNLMQKAKGRDAVEAAGDVVDQGLAAGKGVQGGMQEKITGEFQKQLSSLQVLDNLVGQLDRHEHNYFVQQDSQGRLTGVQGIDNDFSFGDNHNGWKEKYQGTHGRAITDGKGNLTIPHMDRALADRILALPEAAARDCLVDLLEPFAIDAFCKRLRMIQDAIRNEKANKPNSGRFMEDGQWGDQSLEDFREVSAEVALGYASNNYVGRFLSTGEDQSEIDKRAKDRKQAARLAAENAIGFAGQRMAQPPR